MKLLQDMRKQHSELAIAIRVIERLTHPKNETAATADRIRKAVYGGKDKTTATLTRKPYKRKGKHWTQTAAGKKRLQAVLRARWAK